MNDPGHEGNPLQGLLGDLLKVIGSAQTGGGTPWLDAARALAQGVATDGVPEANIDPIRRIELEGLARVAELHVAEATGVALRAHGDAPVFEPVTRGTWAFKSLDAWRPLVQNLLAAQGGPPSLPPGLGFGAGAEGLPDLLARFAATMGPVLVGMQLGSAAGHLAKRALGQYALPLPWPDSPNLLIVPDNVAAFAQDWSLPVDETKLWACIRELVTHSVVSRPQVGARLRELVERSTDQALAAQQGLGERLGIQPGDPDALQQLLSDPESLMADLLTPERRATSSQLTALTTTIAAYADHVTTRIARSLTGSAGLLSEAWHRFRAQDGTGEQAAGALFGFEVGSDEVDRGASFARGVVERAGEEGLDRLWSATRNLPTPAEVDAPGLWLERISLPDDPDQPSASAPGEPPGSPDDPGQPSA
jgi:putative hydrolase